MNLQNIRRELSDLLVERGLSQFEFAARYDLSYSQINKFLNGHVDNPRLSTIEELQRAMRRERGISDRRGTADLS